jgi:hypothetical protein
VVLGRRAKEGRCQFGDASLFPTTQNKRADSLHCPPGLTATGKGGQTPPRLNIFILRLLDGFDNRMYRLIAWAWARLRIFRLIAFDLSASRPDDLW